MTLSFEDVHTFLEAAKDTPYYALFYTSLYTGMRRREVLSLQWGDVDLEMATVSVVRSLQRLPEGRVIMREPKTARSRRLVAMPPSLAIVLREHRQDQENIRDTFGASNSETDFVFAHHDGSPFDPSTITHAFTKLRKRAGLPSIRLHDARHTHATIMLKEHVHPKVVQERLGHSNVAMTLDRYSHAVPGLQEAAALRFDEAMDRAARGDVGKTSATAESRH